MLIKIGVSGSCHRIERGLTRELNLYMLIKIGLSGVKFNDACVLGGRDKSRLVEQGGELPR